MRNADKDFLYDLIVNVIGGAVAVALFIWAIAHWNVELAASFTYVEEQVRQAAAWLIG